MKGIFASAVNVAMGASTATTFTDNFNKFKSGLDELVEGALDALLKATEERDVRTAFDALGRSASRIGQELSDLDSEMSRQQMKQAALGHKMKLESQRAAAKVQMSDQRAQLEAEAAAEMARAIDAARSGGSKDLKSALEEVVRGRRHATSHTAHLFYLTHAPALVLACLLTRRSA